MQGPEISFLALSSLAAAAVGWGARNRALAGALLIGAVGAFLMVPVIGGGARTFTPLFTGAALAALALLPLLVWRDAPRARTRMALALAVVFPAHLAFLSYAMANR
jgi:fatty acid desaturase